MSLCRRIHPIFACVPSQALQGTTSLISSTPAALYSPAFRSTLKKWWFRMNNLRDARIRIRIRNSGILTASVIWAHPWELWNYPESKLSKSNTGWVGIFDLASDPCCSLKATWRPNYDNLPSWHVTSTSKQNRPYSWTSSCKAWDARSYGCRKIHSAGRLPWLIHHAILFDITENLFTAKWFGTRKSSTPPRWRDASGYTTRPNQNVIKWMRDLRV